MSVCLLSLFVRRAIPVVVEAECHTVLLWSHNMGISQLDKDRIHANFLSLPHQNTGHSLTAIC